ncbi:hypothetical protein KC19_9G179400 [Ceratodon purpureus]|uniref:Uncharacterized protein n=1 Tax=Ceratodon purpureus TaxID=3225 RepID=A0A8T0GVG1_CERPU|nr:hypothetical protein KC19_9G179400 [Ceratodon purpureus]
MGGRCSGCIAIVGMSTIGESSALVYDSVKFCVLRQFHRMRGLSAFLGCFLRKHSCESVSGLMTKYCTDFRRGPWFEYQVVKLIGQRVIQMLG